MLTFGVAICHEGWRYPETVRWAARRGAQLVFHPHFHEAEPGELSPVDVSADPPNSFHEKAMLCRAARTRATSRRVNYRQRRIADDVGGRSAGRDAAVPSARTAQKDCSSPTSGSSTTATGLLAGRLIPM